MSDDEYSGSGASHEYNGGVEYYRTAADVNKGWDTNSERTYKFKKWPQVFSFAVKVAKEILAEKLKTNKSFTYIKAVSLAWKDPRVIAAKKQFDTYKEKFGTAAPPKKPAARKPATRKSSTTRKPTTRKKTTTAKKK